MPRNTSPLPFSSPRRGAANRAVLALLISAAILVFLTITLSRGVRQPQELTIYCAAGLREPMEAIRAAYAKECGVDLTIQYGGSGQLLSSLELGNHDADLFLPADESYLELAREREPELIGPTLAVARMRPILAVKKDNPLKIYSLDDVLTKNVRVSMTEPGWAATGNLVYDALQRAGKWDAFRQRITVSKITVSEVAADLQVGAADAGVIWDAMLKQLPEFEEVPLPELAGVTARVVAGVITHSKHPQAARDLAAFLAAPDQGQRYFLDAGFSPIEARNTNQH